MCSFMAYNPLPVSPCILVQLAASHVDPFWASSSLLIPTRPNPSQRIPTHTVRSLRASHEPNEPCCISLYTDPPPAPRLAHACTAMARRSTRMANRLRAASSRSSCAMSFLAQPSHHDPLALAPQPSPAPPYPQVGGQPGGMEPHFIATRPMGLQVGGQWSGKEPDRTSRLQLGQQGGLEDRRHRLDKEGGQGEPTYSRRVADMCPKCILSVPEVHSEGKLSAPKV